ncbi:MAG: PhoH family protein [Deltaproteobacteria bacterium]|nr:PhoH family protein [Deltaproteobacteria bacterium]
MNVKVTHRGDALRIVGGEQDVIRTESLLRQLYELVGTGFALHPSAVDHACRMMRESQDAPIQQIFSETLLIGVKKKAIFPRTPRQRSYVNAIRANDIVFGVGPAGTGKTYLAMAMAVGALKRGEVNRIVLCRPAVEAGEKLGFLPGDLAEKVNPYLRPLYDALHDMIETDKVQRFIEQGVIEVAPLAFMRGRTLSESFIILDEAQNTTSEQMKMFLTRLGFGSKAVVTGDITQIDLPGHTRSGLVEAIEVLRDVPGIEFAHFSHLDVVRHGLVSKIIQAYDRHRAPKRGRDSGPGGAP